MGGHRFAAGLAFILNGFYTEESNDQYLEYNGILPV
jgi:hypothetical protein